MTSMTPEQINIWLEIHHRQMLALERIANALERLAPKTAPNYQYPLESLKSFNWDSIGATVERSDKYGAAVVSWNGQQYMGGHRDTCKMGHVVKFCKEVNKKPRFTRIPAA